MRSKTLIVIIMLVTLTLARAQDSEYPTLDALAELEIPPYDYADMLRRWLAYNPSYSAPTSPPLYQIGDRESFQVPVDDNWFEEAVPMELRGMTENVLIWVEESASYSRLQAQALAERVEVEVLGPLKQLLDYTEPPGVDGDPRLIVAMIHNVEWSARGTFVQVHALPRVVFSKSNQREMMVVSLANEDGTYLHDDSIAETIAHEYQHILLYHRDRTEELWLNEALSEFATYYIYGSEEILWGAEDFLRAPNIGLTKFHAGASPEAKYVAGALFMVFLAEQFGEEIVARLHAESQDGWRAVDKVLQETVGLSADEVFADWVLANYFLDAERGYGYQSLDLLPTQAQPVATLHEFPASHSGGLPQYSSDYLAVSARGADKLSLRLTLAPEAHLINVSPYEGDHFFYAATIERANSRLTREIDLNTHRRAWLEFRIWHDLEENFEYGFVEISTDGGETWSILPGEYTTDESHYGRFQDDGYNGRSGGWLHERIDLLPDAAKKFLLRFHVVSDGLTSYKGMAIDDLRIDAIDYHDGFESHDDAWIAEGWIRTDNRLPQRTWLQVVQETGDGLHLDRHLMTASGDITVDLLPGVSQVLIAISPVVPQTSLETEYALEVNLIDAEGNAMTVARECTVTTTHALNFRDAPNGDKIGLLPQGTAVRALDLSEGWFKVRYDSKVGWISGGYVTTKGNCA